MKKALFLVCILSVSVITTACINNLAVQELNNKAAVYMEKGNYSEAIERLKSSIDLDDSLFESHYNLATAYTKNEDYLNAIPEYQKTIELKPDFADVYYSLAVTQEDLITELQRGRMTVTDADTIEKIDDENDIAQEGETIQDKAFTPNFKTKQYINTLNSEAIKNYETYLVKNPQASDKAEVEARIKDLQSQVENTAEPVKVE